MFAKEVPWFPEGSVIVKEKISTNFEGRKPLLYTIMRKREQGCNPELGDWQFSAVGANGTQVEATGKLENCQGSQEQKRFGFHIPPLPQVQLRPSITKCFSLFSHK